MMRAACLAAALLASAPASAEQCRQALALGLDVSGSVDGGEYRMQIDGLARALVHPEVIDAFLQMPAAPVSIAVYEWSGPPHQRMLAEWRALRSRADVASLSAELLATRRLPREPSTALGTAIAFGLNLLEQQPTCWKRTLDVSGDGKSNTGPHPRDMKQGARARSITVNALVIGADSARYGGSLHVGISELSSYFNAYVIEGPDAFVETALGFEDYERAMVRKLKRELQSLAISRAPSPNRLQ